MNCDYWLMVKGAPEIIIQMCKTMNIEGHETDVDDALLDAFKV